MFCLVTLTDRLALPPRPLPRHVAIRRAIHAKYANRILPDAGLCIAQFNILTVSDADILPGDPNLHVRTTFQLVVFRPLMDEVMLGVIRGCVPRGISISIGFFEDIFCPAEHLPEGAFWDVKDQIWCWKYDEGVLPYTVGDACRFRVVSEAFKTEAHARPVKEGVEKVANGVEEVPREEIEEVAPYSLVASMATDGLGLVSWWQD